MDSAVQRWGSTALQHNARSLTLCRSFAAQRVCACEAVATPSFLDSFRNAFTPVRYQKYDVPRPTYDRWCSLGVRGLLPRHGISFILAKRTFLTLYMTLVQEVLQSVEEQEEALQQGHEPADIDWGEIWHKLKSTLPDIGWGALREWLTEGIRIFYARRVYRNCNRRLTWKLLKGATHSSLRKLARGGGAAVPRMVWTFLRGDALQTAAEATMRGAILPWRLHRVVQNPHGAPARAVAATVAKHAGVELACVACRYVTASVASALLVSGGYWFLKLVGAERHEKAFTITQGGEERPMYTSVFVCISAAGFVGDAAAVLCRSWMQAQLDVAPQGTGDGPLPALPGPGGAGEPKLA